MAERTSASATVTRSEIKISYKNLPIIKAIDPALCIHNINGGDLYFYPGFLIVYESASKFDLINYVDLQVTYNPQRFIESEKVPSDAEVVDQTWLKVNKDGSPDRRFTGNYQIPVVLYGQMAITSSSGLNELYCFSNCEYTKLFAKSINDYISSLLTADTLLKQFR